MVRTITTALLGASLLLNLVLFEKGRRDVALEREKAEAGTIKVAEYAALYLDKCEEGDKAYLTLLNNPAFSSEDEVAEWRQRYYDLKAEADQLYDQVLYYERNYVPLTPGVELRRDKRLRGKYGT